MSFPIGQVLPRLEAQEVVEETDGVFEGEGVNEPAQVGLFLEVALLLLGGGDRARMFRFRLLERDVVG